MPPSGRCMNCDDTRSKAARAVRPGVGRARRRARHAIRSATPAVGRRAPAARSRATRCEVDRGDGPAARGEPDRVRALAAADVEARRASRPAASATSCGLGGRSRPRRWRAYRSSQASCSKSPSRPLRRATARRVSSATRSALIIAPARSPRRGRRDDLGRRSVTLPATQTPGTAVPRSGRRGCRCRTRRRHLDGSTGSRPSGARKSARGRSRGETTTSASRATTSPSASRTPVSGRPRPPASHRAVDDRGCRGRRAARASSSVGRRARWWRNSVTSSLHCRNSSAWCTRHPAGGQHADRLVAHLPAVAVRAVQHVAAPPLGQPGHVGQLVDQPGRHQQPAGARPRGRRPG